MAAPGVVTPGTPLGAKMPEGFRCKLSFGRLTTFAFWARELTPAPVNNGNALDVTTFYNTLFKTKRPQVLYEVGDIQAVGLWDADIFKDAQYKALLGLESNISILFPQGSTFSVFGYLQSITPSRMTHGEVPMTTINVVVTNWDYVNHVEAGPAYADGYTGTADS